MMLNQICRQLYFSQLRGKFHLFHLNGTQDLTTILSAYQVSSPVSLIKHFQSNTDWYFPSPHSQKEKCVEMRSCRKDTAQSQSTYVWMHAQRMWRSLCRAPGSAQIRSHSWTTDGPQCLCSSTHMHQHKGSLCLIPDGSQGLAVTCQITPFCLFNHTIISEIFNTVDWTFILDLSYHMCLNECGLIAETIKATQMLWSIFIVTCNSILTTFLWSRISDFLVYQILGWHLPMTTF